MKERLLELRSRLYQLILKKKTQCQTGGIKHFKEHLALLYSGNPIRSFFLSWIKQASNELHFFFHSITPNTKQNAN